MSRLGFALSLTFVLAACRCDKPVGQVDVAFRVDDTSLDFGRVLQGTQLTKPVSVVNTGTVSLTLDVSTAEPFEAPLTLELPGGTSVDLDVTFDAGGVLALGTLFISEGDAGFTVQLKGLGVPPLQCNTGAPCHESHYDFPTDRCVETTLADTTPCTPTSTCLEKGQCLAGTCIGVPRACDDQNPCTIDGCAEGIGCVNSPRTCPSPNDPCRVATCNPSSGCGDMPAPAGTVCGKVDCHNANVCDTLAHCLTIPTPDGFPCSPPTPCQGQGTCQQGDCTKPPVGILLPALSLPLGGVPTTGRPMLMSFANELFGEVCALPLDVVDAGPVDAGDSDGGPADAGDAGAADAGLLDAGTADGGTCALFSYTNNGFERFTLKFPDTLERAFVHVANPGVAMLAPPNAPSPVGLEVRSLADGTLRWRTDFNGPVAPKGIAAALDGTTWVLVGDDAGATQLLALVDGGSAPAVSLDGSVQLLALDEQGGAWAFGPTTGQAARLPASDAGVPSQDFTWLSAPDASTVTLATTALSAVTGNRQLFSPDAGLLTAFEWTDDAGEPLRVIERFSLMSSQRAVVFYAECPQPLTSCDPAQEDLRQRAFSVSTGEIIDDIRMAAPGVATHVVEAGLLSISGFPPATLAVLQSFTDAGVPSASLRLVVSGADDLACPLIPGTEVAAATFGDGVLWLYDRRDGGPYMLESYSLMGLDVSQSGWSLADGVAGQRRAR